MPAMESDIHERLDHVGIVAGVIGFAARVDEQDPANRYQVKGGTATTAMILNGLGFSNQHLSVAPQSCANTPVERRGISADLLTDECPWSGWMPTIRRRSLQALLPRRE
jgi:hypothetical protein